MEEKIFRLPAVAGVLARHFVEARLHTDGVAHVERILEVQAELAGSRATPIYVVVDPSTGARRATFEGPTREPERFVDFLERARTTETAAGRDDAPPRVAGR
jgi:hypothetical protein